MIPSLKRVKIYDRRLSAKKFLNNLGVRKRNNSTFSIKFRSYIFIIHCHKNPTQITIIFWNYIMDVRIVFDANIVKFFCCSFTHNRSYVKSFYFYHFIFRI